jgi:5-methylcytosine-specific restriction endonuclease McrA
MRICNICKVEKEFGLFYKKKGALFGIQSVCKVCQDLKKKRIYENNKEIINKQRKEKYAKKDKSTLKVKRREEYKKNKINILKDKKDYYIKNRENILERNKQNKEVISEYNKKYAKQNPQISRLREKEKRLIKCKSLNLLKDTYREQVKYIYKFVVILQNVLGIKIEIDHIIPIKNKNVCGLHVPWNLQYLLPEENRQKSNQFDGTYENESWRNKWNLTTLD